MQVMPIPRWVRSFPGPQATCLHTACPHTTCLRGLRAPLHLPPGAHPVQLEVHVHARQLYGFIRSLLSFSCSLLVAGGPRWPAAPTWACVLLRVQLQCCCCCCCWAAGAGTSACSASGWSAPT